MSKHFELMQQMEKEQLFDSKPAASPIFTADSTRYGSTSHKRWADEEALSLVQQIFLLQTKEPPRVVVFAGIDHGSGCSQVCVSVAETLAKNSAKPVCLVEANFRSPGLSGVFGTANHHGLTEALRQEGHISSFTKPVSQPNLWLLSSGSLAVDSPNLLTSDLLRERVRELREDFDFIIIDAPPLNRYADAVILGQHSNGVVLVLEADATRRESATKVATTLRSANVPILAAVLNKRTYPIPETIYSRL